MPGAEFMFLIGDTPLVIPGNSGDKEVILNFKDHPKPDIDKPSLIMLNVQGLADESEIRMNGRLIGSLSPSPHVIINNITKTLTSPNYGNDQLYYTLHHGSRNSNIYIKDILNDIQVNLQGTNLDTYWTTQMIKLGAGKRAQAGVEESGQSKIYSDDDDDNSLTFASVSADFQIKDLVYHYHTGP